MTVAHAEAVLAIYQAGLDTGNASLETTAPHWAGWDAARLAGHRFVALLDGEVAGWVSASALSDRCAYAGVVEHSVSAPGNGWGGTTGGGLSTAVGLRGTLIVGAVGMAGSLALVMRRSLWSLA
jgi:L-amino acid N-acyltransferase YncA